MAKDSYGKELEAIRIILEALGALDEAQRTFVIRTVSDRLNLAGTLTSATSREPEVASNHQLAARTPTPKAFMRQKQPASGVEQLTCLAYYLSNYLNKANFKTVELTKLNNEAGGHRISNPAVFARNAASQNGYLAPAGGGRKRITNLGELVVEAMPDREKVKAVLSQHRKPKARRTKGASKK